MSDPGADLIAERERTHGSIGDNSRRFAQLLEAVPLECFPAELRYCVTGILTKLARAASGDGAFAGHWDDVEGYARLAAGIVRRVHEVAP